MLNHLSERPSQIIKIIDKRIAQRSLNLSDKEIGDDEMDYIYSKDCSQIEAINLHRSQITDQGLRNFSKAKWGNVTYLQLCSNQIEDLGCKYLSKARMSVHTLSVNRNNISSVGILHLSKAVWKNLRYLDISSCKLEVGSVHWLTKADWDLARITIYGNKFRIEQGKKLVFLHSTDMERISYRIDKGQKFVDFLEDRFHRTYLNL